MRDPRVKPPFGAVLDWGDPINRGLVGCWLLNEGVGSGSGKLRCNDLVSANTVTALGDGVSWVPGDAGVALGFADNPSRASSINPATISGSITCVARFFTNTVASSNIQGVFGNFMSGSTARGVCFSTRLRTLEFWGGPNIEGNGYSRKTIPSDVINSGVYLTVAVTNDGSISRAYQNGAYLSSWAAPTSHVNTRWTFGDWSYTYAGNYCLNGVIDYARSYSRILSTDEIQRLYQEPYCGISDDSASRYYSLPGLRKSRRTIDGAPFGGNHD